MANNKQKRARLVWRKEQKSAGYERPARKSSRHGYTRKEWRDKA